MPIYEYKCTNCGFQKEYLRKVSDPAETDCPSCGKATFSKMVTAAGFQLKGTGWYVTDFRNSGGAPGADSGGAKTATKGVDPATSAAGAPTAGGDSVAPAASAASATPAAAADAGSSTGGGSTGKADTSST